jgi:glycosyltransferase involved in cell wall biosynthesis
MTDKIKLSAICDAGAPTGFASVSHQILGYLQDTGEYEINILGINFKGIPNQWSKKFNIWPAALGNDFLGIGYTEPFLKATNPDLLFLFQDFWNIPHYLAHRPAKLPSVLYYPVDAPNIKGQYMLALAAGNEHVCYTHFGVQESVRGATEAYDTVVKKATKKGINAASQLVAAVNNPVMLAQEEAQVEASAQKLVQMKDEDHYHVIPHGIDTEHFFPLDKEFARVTLGLNMDWFIVGNVNRNQSRKRQDLMLKAFSIFAKDKPDVRLALHCVRNDAKGWDLSQLAEYYGVRDKILFTHDLFSGRQAAMDELNVIYNVLDVQFNTGGGEGWGLTSFEGAASGIPQVVPNWSATKEIWAGHAWMLDIVEVRHEPYMINTAQGVIDTAQAARYMQELYEDRNKLEKLGAECKAVVERPEYSWQAVGAQFDKVFKSAIGKPLVFEPVAFNEEGEKYIAQMELQARMQRQTNAKTIPNSNL